MNYTTTKPQILPYEFIRLDEQTVRIINTNRQTLKVTQAQILKQLNNPDIDPHRRRMYEGALIALQRGGQS